MLKGKVHKYGADVDTDAILPGQYLNLTTMEELARHCLEDADPDFLKRVQPGDIMMATTNFGRDWHLLRHRQKLCPHLLPQCNKHRPATAGV